MAGQTKLAVPDQAEVATLNKLKDAWGSDLSLHLMVAPTAVSQSTVMADVTEASFPGYAEQPVTFGTVATDANNRAHMTADAVTFTCDTDTSPVEITGFYLTDDVTDETVLYGIFVDDADTPTPIIIEFDNDSIRVTIDYTLREEPDPM